MTITTEQLGLAFFLLTIVALVAFSPGYWEYQKIRWLTKIPPSRSRRATTKATEELLGHGELTSGDFQMVSADLLRVGRKMAEYNDLAMILRVGYLNRLRDDPTGEDLKQRLYDEIASDVAERIDDDSQLSDSLRVSAYDYATSDPKFKELLLERIGSLDRLKISDEQAETIKAEQDGSGQPAPPPESE